MVGQPKRKVLLLPLELHHELFQFLPIPESVKMIATVTNRGLADETKNAFQKKWNNVWKRLCNSYNLGLYSKSEAKICFKELARKTGSIRDEIIPLVDVIMDSVQSLMDRHQEKVDERKRKNAILQRGAANHNMLADTDSEDCEGKKDVYYGNDRMIMYTYSFVQQQKWRNAKRIDEVKMRNKWAATHNEELNGADAAQFFVDKLLSFNIFEEHSDNIFLTRDFETVQEEILRRIGLSNADEKLADFLKQNYTKWGRRRTALELERLRKDYAILYVSLCKKFGECNAILDKWQAILDSITEDGQQKAPTFEEGQQQEGTSAAAAVAGCSSSSLTTTAAEQHPNERQKYCQTKYGPVPMLDLANQGKNRRMKPIRRHMFGADGAWEENFFNENLDEVDFDYEEVDDNDFDIDDEEEAEEEEEMEEDSEGSEEDEEEYMELEEMEAPYARLLQKHAEMQDYIREHFDQQQIAQAGLNVNVEQMPELYGQLQQEQARLQQFIRGHLSEEQMEQAGLTVDDQFIQQHIGHGPEGQ